MKNDKKNSAVVDVFVDVEAHQVTADIIKKHSTNRTDIREIALENLDLSQRRDILELGCGFGFFTASLKDRLGQGATVTGVDIIREYGPLFIATCQGAGIRGNFVPSDVSVIKQYKDQSFDLVICSYSLYFFPEIISEISRILTANGLLVATVHNQNNMGQLIRFAKTVLINHSMIGKNDKLPIEILIDKFSSKNGAELLFPWFEGIIVKDYENTLVFKPADMYLLMEYFRFKWPFFLSKISVDLGMMFDLFETQFQKYFNRSPDGFAISKDDTIFVCSKPLYSKGQE